MREVKRAKKKSKRRGGRALTGRDFLIEDVDVASGDAACSQL